MAQQKDHIGDTNKMITAVKAIILDLDIECKSRGMFINWDIYLVMEKEQIINAWIATDNELQRIAAIKYYNEKFKK